MNTVLYAVGNKKARESIKGIFTPEELEWFEKNITSQYDLNAMFKKEMKKEMKKQAKERKAGL